MDRHTHSEQVQRLAVVDTERRRRWSEDEKLRFVTESLGGSRLVSSTARRYGISPSQLFAWRRSFRAVPTVKCEVGPVGPAFVPEKAALPEMERLASSEALQELCAQGARQALPSTNGRRSSVRLGNALGHTDHERCPDAY